MMQLFWFLLVSLLLPAVAQKDSTDTKDPRECFKNNKGIATSTVAGGLCVTSTEQGFSTIGNDELVKDRRAQSLSQKWIDTPYDGSWKLEVFPVMHDGQNVFGWFHVVLKGDKKTSGIVIIMAVLDSDSYLSPHAGQFIWTNTKQGSCAEVPQGDTVKEKFVPCHFAVDPLPFASRIFVDVSSGSNPLKDEYRLNFKAIFARCDITTNNKIFFRTIIIGESSGKPLRFAQTQLLTWNTDRITYVTAVDPAPPPDGSADCSMPNMPPWVANVINLNTDADRKIPMQIKTKSCTTESCSTGHYWEGRCEPFNNGWVHYEFGYKCVGREEKPEENISDYYKDYVPRVEAVTTICVNETNCTQALALRMRFGEDVGSPIGVYIWGARKGHGVLMSVASFLAYPLSAYFARYYKETYMKTRAVINLHVWYTAHIFGSFIVLSFIISGTGVGIYGRLFYGHSTSLCGVLHRVFGWLGTVLFLVGMITSGLRIAPVPTRKIAILVHFLTGMFYQISNWLSLVTCACIPGSPPGTEQMDKGEIGSFPLFWLLAVVWLVFEIVMNILASLQICEADKVTEFIPKRKLVFGLVYMPSLTADSMKDLVGKEKRKFLLHIYTLGNSIITVLALILVIYPDHKDRYFGIMELTHFKNGSNRFADNYDEYAEIDDD